MTNKPKMMQELQQNLAAHRINPSRGPKKYALGLCRVMDVNSIDKMVTLKVIKGQQEEFQRLPIPITFPGAGGRYFIGGMPEVGDYCVVGHMAQESSGGTTIPVILGWVPPAPWMGYDWNPSQPFAPDEFDFDPKGSTHLDGVFNRIRHKSTQMEPGNILLSSSQGSDIFLHEGIMISNRRSNEIWLRDSDQSIVFRSKAQHHALSGARHYAGPVQRDARLLPPQVLDTGIVWDGPRQVDENDDPLPEYLLPDTPTEIKGGLDPADVFFRSDGSTLPDSGINIINPNTDPYNVLQRGLFIDEEGLAIDPDSNISDAIYGGKSIYRVSQDIGDDGNPLNAELGSVQAGRSLSELRWEVNHTSDGRLPVTEQTDGFDAERLPGSQGDLNDSINQSGPFLEYVLGSVVGNDPYTTNGIPLYGKPLAFTIVDDDNAVSPSIDSAIGLPISDHAATLFRMQPPLAADAAPTYWGVQKDGVIKGSIAGPRSKRWSAEFTFSSGLFINTDAEAYLQSQKGVTIKGSRGPQSTNLGVEISSDNGAVKIFGGGKSAEGRLGRQDPIVGGGSADQPSVHIEGKGDVVISSGRKLRLNASSFDFGNSASANISATSSVSINSGDKVRITSKTFDTTVFGKAVETYSGPKDFLPTNLPIREEQFIANPATGHVGGPTDQYTLLFGDRIENIGIGNHITTVAVGSATYQVLGGVWSAGAGLNRLAIDSATGINAVTPVGNITMTSATGAIALTSTLSARVFSTGVTTISGVGGVALGGPGKVGLIVCSSDLDPLTGLPLATFFMGSPGHSLILPA